jgi:hypothetical protein
VVRNNIAYVGHVKPPDGTSIIDVSDPSKPRDLARISVPEGTLSHKVRVENGLCRRHPLSRPHICWS